MGERFFCPCQALNKDPFLKERERQEREEGIVSLDFKCIHWLLSVICETGCTKAVKGILFIFKGRQAETVHRGNGYEK